jgi:hypothetical protein
MAGSVPLFIPIAALSADVHAGGGRTPGTAIRADLQEHPHPTVGSGAVVRLDLVASSLVGVVTGTRDVGVGAMPAHRWIDDSRRGGGLVANLYVVFEQRYDKVRVGHEDNVAVGLEYLIRF